jgi:cytochrome b6-f complex iron-sulfur subunit
MIPQSISRKEFLKNLGLSSSALWAIYCGVGLSACSSEEVIPQGSSSDRLDFNIDMNDRQYSELKYNGSYVVVNDVVVAKTLAGKYAAVSVLCTHQLNKDIVYSSGYFLCIIHGSKFDDAGHVIKGPAKTDIKQYQVVQNENILRIIG